MTGTTDGLTDKIEVKVLVTNVNEAPKITRATGDDEFTFAENTATTRVLHSYRATDEDGGDSITWTLEGADKDAFTIDGNGNLRFSGQQDYDTKEELEITIVATDDGTPSKKDEISVKVTLTDVNEPPEIAGAADVHHDENADHPVAPYAATDPEGDIDITWSLGGTDRSDFTITSGGQLEFASPPNFERPADSGGNNVYNVQVRATDDATPPQTGTFDVTVWGGPERAADHLRRRHDVFPGKRRHHEGARPLRCHRPRAEAVYLVAGRDGRRCLPHRHLRQPVLPRRPEPRGANGLWGRQRVRHPGGRHRRR